MYSVYDAAEDLLMKSTSAEMSPVARYRQTRLCWVAENGRIAWNRPWGALTRPAGGISGRLHTPRHGSVMGK